MIPEDVFEKYKHARLTADAGFEVAYTLRGMIIPFDPESSHTCTDAEERQKIEKFIDAAYKKNPLKYKHSKPNVESIEAMINVNGLHNESTPYTFGQLVAYMEALGVEINNNANNKSCTFKCTPPSPSKSNLAFSSEDSSEFPWQEHAEEADAPLADNFTVEYKYLQLTAAAETPSKPTPAPTRKPTPKPAKPTPAPARKPVPKLDVPQEPASRPVAKIKLPIESYQRPDCIAEGMNDALKETLKSWDAVENPSVSCRKSLKTLQWAIRTIAEEKGFTYVSFAEKTGYNKNYTWQALREGGVAFTLKYAKKVTEIFSKKKLINSNSLVSLVETALKIDQAKHPTESLSTTSGVEMPTFTVENPESLGNNDAQQLG